MKRLHVLHIVVIYCIFIFTTAVAQAKPEPLTLVTGYWTPYVDQSLPNQGFISEIVKASVALMQRDLQLKWLPWTRGEEYIARGIHFATFPYAKNTRRESVFHFSDPLYFVETRFFYNTKDQAEVLFEDLNDLKAYRIGAVRGYGYVDRLKKADLELYLVNRADQLIDMLARKRVDIIAVNGRSGWRMLEEMYPAQISEYATLDKPLNKRHGVHLMVSRSFPNYLAITNAFNRALAMLKSSGEYDKILLRNLF